MSGKIPCPKCGLIVPCRCYVAPAGDQDKIDYELQFKDGLKMTVREYTFSRAIALGAYQRLLAGGETHRQLTVEKGGLVKKNRQLSDDDEEALVSEDEIRALAEMACQKSNGSGWNTMWSGDQEAQIESWIEGYKAGSGRPYFTVPRMGWGEGWQAGEMVPGEFVVVPDPAHVRIFDLMVKDHDFEYPGLCPFCKYDALGPKSEELEKIWEEYCRTRGRGDK